VGRASSRAGPEKMAIRKDRLAGALVPPGWSKSSGGRFKGIYPPTIAHQSWLGTMQIKGPSPGRDGRRMVAVRQHLSSLTGLGTFPNHVPSHKWPGYFQRRDQSRTTKPRSAHQRGSLYQFIALAKRFAGAGCSRKSQTPRRWPGAGLGKMVAGFRLCRFKRFWRWAPWRSAGAWR